ncbi:Peptidoglycan-binding (PGRP) domain of peptidoglycan hydrolases-containing protein [Peptoniphilus asaccharolyticus DSM 20463]|uniref:Peptidoglycan-binding (PGRP) domain of peptidoglycan hydrolases-containing protein n=1 Tax=Peptoniphilus asaccharolyticus DSM 20463 TaxID=573058 RepID=A0A1W1UCN3_PEPAS|nr:glycoside hydrolase domain-containing protein [Peptoniphilus asaccharolyticus]MBL7576461.1 DUF1906 domain-containing protein [Peptoniphilus asaccharolyticus]SMB78803.1 Peptidoglycan-binding (PGRP) domain of peptidoglycan hydrolases-containing protein [Peptoniphilus asaccharolyticus DSM 20463]
MDQMVLETQKWLNETYGKDSRFKKVDENGKTGWPTINALTRALQIELGISNTADNFGPGTQSLFSKKWPSGISEQNKDDKTTSNVYSIIQGALWCKGYSVGSGISQNFYSGTGTAIKKLKADMGIGGDSTVTLDIMKALLSMQQFVLLSRYCGRFVIRDMQQKINRKYREYTGIIPTDGLYGREMNKAMIKILQSIQGYSPTQATGNFGNGTKSKLVTITQNNYGSYPDYLWIAKVMLICNGYHVEESGYWDISFETSIRLFQEEYALSKTGKVDTDTWMSLFISKGNISRKAIACDTRFEITSDLLNKLKSDGYEIVGRYLTGGSFKEIREGELQRIIDGGMKYFPIFQENGREISEFTYIKGLEHGEKASEAALSKGIPSTVIYFAVDMDVYDYQIDSNIIPYFKGINETIDSRYSVGIYASRNVCTRVANVGYSISSFVSDMSTGFSGNLGFPIPNNWNYDQFHEIKKYGGKWDLDKVAYSGKISACNTVDVPKEYILSSYLPKEVNVKDLKPTIFNAIDLVKKIELVYSKYQLKSFQNGNFNIPFIYQGVLNFLSKKYLKGYGKFSIAVTPFDDSFDEYFKAEDIKIYNEVKSFIENEISDTKVGLNDLQHWAVTTLAYCILNNSPDTWVGWAGDLATGMRTLNVYMSKYPNLDVKKSAVSLIGAYTETASDYFISNKVDIKKLGNECHFIDLCDDADAIGISRLVNKDNGINNLSTAMSIYYTNITKNSRYSQYKYDGLDFSNINSLEKSIKNVMDSILTKFPKFGLNSLKGNSTEEEQNACCYAFAYYLLRNTH